MGLKNREKVKTLHHLTYQIQIETIIYILLKISGKSATYKVSLVSNEHKTNTYHF